MDELRAENFGQNYWRSVPSVDAVLPPMSSAPLDDGAFRLLADAIPTLCWIANGDGYIVWFNGRWHAYCGTTPAQMQGWGWTAVHDPAFLPEVIARWTQSIASGQPFEMTFPLRGADGVFRPFLTRVQPVRDATGQVVRWFGVNTDISGQVAAERALDAERDRSREVLRHMGHGFMLMDRDFRILEMNEHAARMENRAMSDLVGQTHWEAWPGSEGSELGQTYRIAMRDRQPAELEHLYIWPDGRRAWVEMRAFPSSDGLAVFYRDISRRKSIEAALRDGEARFRAIADSMPQMVWSAMPDGAHDYFNARWYEFTGVPEGSTDGEAWRGLFHPDEQDRISERWRHSLETGAPYEIEYRLRHHAGGYRWTLGRALPIRDASGQITRWFGTCTDIHDAKRQSEETELLSQELSHRIGNIFAVISGLIGLSVRYAPEARELAADLRERIAALGRAHDFARPHSEKSRPVTGDTTLLALLEELLRPYPALDEGRITFEGEPLPVDDRAATPLALIFHELATNAAKYGALSTSAGRVSIATRQEGNSLTVVWREQGGPDASQPPVRQGFGERLISVSVEGQLGGSFVREWLRDGLLFRMTVPTASLTRG